MHSSQGRIFIVGSPNHASVTIELLPRKTYLKSKFGRAVLTERLYLGGRVHISRFLEGYRVECVLSRANGRTYE